MEHNLGDCIVAILSFVGGYIARKIRGRFKK